MFEQQNFKEIPKKCKVTNQPFRMVVESRILTNIPNIQLQISKADWVN